MFEGDTVVVTKSDNAVLATNTLDAIVNAKITFETDNDIQIVNIIPIPVKAEGSPLNKTKDTDDHDSYDLCKVI